ncbi:MAG TPA: hypothetical protein VIL69_23170 [Roseomonas sp.]|jgi:hypothetical protein
MASDYVLPHRQGHDFPNTSRKVHMKVWTTTGVEDGKATIISGLDRQGSFVWRVSYYEPDLEEYIVGWTDDRRVAEEWAELWPRSFAAAKAAKVTQLGDGAAKT